MLKIEKVQRLDLGIRGENQSRAIEIDCNLWREMYPNGYISVYHQRPGETAPDVTGAIYNATTGILRWEVTETDAYIEGEGEAEFRLTENGVVKKSRKIKTIIHQAVTNGIGGGTIESNQQAYLDAAAAIMGQSQLNTSLAEEYAKDSEAWAKGTRAGVEVDEEDDAYENNAEYYAGEAGAAATAAETYAGNAATSATAAAGSATNAAGSATAAAGSATNAAGSATAAAASAEAAAQAMGGKADKTNTVLTSTLSRGRKAETAIGEGSFAFGNNVTASGKYSFASGQNSQAKGLTSFAHGAGTIASGTNSHVFGKYNVEDGPDTFPEWVSETEYAVGDKVKRTVSPAIGALYYVCKVANNDMVFTASNWEQLPGGTLYAEIIGNGTSDNARSNARTLDWFGNEEIAGDLTINKGTANETSVGALKTAVDGKIDEPSSEGTSGQVLTTDGNGGRSWTTVQGGGTSDYADLANKPQIAGVTLAGNKSLADLGAASTADVSAKYTKPSGGIPSTDLASGVIPDISGKLNKPSGNGTSGQVLRTNGDGTTIWDNDASTATVEQEVDNWLTANITNPSSPPLDRSLSSSSAAAPADMVGELKSAINFVAKGYQPVEKTYNWINGYVGSSSGKIISDSGAIVSIVEMNVGDQIVVGTRLRNCTIISSTTAQSIAVGDTVTPIVTANSDNTYKEYTYTASDEISLVVGVRASEYSIVVFRESDFAKEVENDYLKADIVLTGSQESNYIYFENISIPTGTEFYADPTLVSGTSSDLQLYANTTDSGNLLANMTYGQRTYFKATQDITRLIGYARDYSSAVISCTVTIPNEAWLVNKSLLKFEDDLDQKLSSTTVNKNIIGSKPGMLYPCYIPKGSNVSFSTADGSNLTRQVKINFYDKDKTYKGYYAFYSGSASRTIDISSLNTDIYYVSYDREGKDGTAMQVEVGAEPTTFIAHIDNAKGLEERVDNIEETVNADILPAYAETQVNSILTTLSGLQNSKSASIAFLTDIHVNGATQYDTTQRAMRVSAIAINRIAKKQPIDFVMCNGDYLYNSTSSTKTAMLGYYAELAKTIRKLNSPVFLGKGNHDINDIATSSSEHMSDEELYQAFLKYTTLKYTGDYGHIENAYGYYDIPNRKIRCIFVNTVDVDSDEQHATGVGSDQVKFIAEALTITESGWGIVFFSHHPLQAGTAIDPSDSVQNHLNPANGGTQLMGVINAYMNKGTYTDATYGISVDYSGNGSDEVICLISGHSHADRGAVVDGILMVSSTSASFVYTGKDADGDSISRTGATETETSWDIITIDRKNSKVYATRYGAGSIANREYSYGS